MQGEHRTMEPIAPPIVAASNETRNPKMSAAVTDPSQNDLSLPRLVPPARRLPRPRGAGRTLALSPNSSAARIPSGLYVLSLAEAGERFGFYLMLALFTLYLNEQLGFSQVRAASFYGSLSGGLLCAAFFGGWLGRALLARGASGCLSGR